MNRRPAGLTATLILVAAGSISASSVAATGDFRLLSTIAFASNRDHLGLIPPINGFEVYLAQVDATNPDPMKLTNLRRMTDNLYGDAFANLSPDGKKVVFDSNRLTAGTVCDGVPRLNISDLFLMDTDGTEQTFLTRGSSATWSPD